MQYSKYNDPSRVVRDQDSPAQALCAEELDSDYLEENNITLYFVATTLLPIITTIIFMAVMWRYKNKIDDIITTSTYWPQLTSICLTGALITIYIFCVDISSVHYFKTKNHEYSDNGGINLISLHWTHVTLTTEIVLSAIAAQFTYGFLFFKSSSVANGLYDIKVNIVEELNRAKVSFIAVPIIFFSTHINYILAAWLTEPSKTTSVATLAIALILVLYVMNKFLYSSAKTTMELIVIRKRLCCLCCVKNKDTCIEMGTLFITIPGAIFGAGLISIEVAAFYILPFPAVNLANYLQNILQVSIFLVSALVTYKFLSKDSESSKKGTDQDKKDTEDSDTSEKIDNKRSTGLSKKATELTITLEAEVKLNDTKNEPPIKLTEPTLTIKFPSDEENIYGVPVFKTELRLHKFMSQKIGYISLANAAVKVYLCDDCSQKFTVRLRDGELIMDRINYKLSEKIIQLIHTERGSDLQAILKSSTPYLKEDDIDINKKSTISVTSTCYLRKFGEVNHDESCCYKYDSIITINGEPANLVLPDNPKIKIFFLKQ